MNNNPRFQRARTAFAQPGEPLNEQTALKFLAQAFGKPEEELQRAHSEGKEITFTLFDGTRQHVHIPNIPREYTEGPEGEAIEITLLPTTELPRHTHRTGSTPDDQPRHNRERHPVDEHQAAVQQRHAGALRDMARRLKRENEKAVDEAVQRLWARLHPQADSLEV